jgi:FkbM family methyltransferase
MTAPFDLAPYGAHLPCRFVRTVLAVTRRLPANWLGLRLSMPLRRIAIDWLRGRPVDTTVWNARMRLYPGDNACEKNALFTPQMYDLNERGELATALDRRLAENGTFTFLDIGANVGLYSLFLANRGAARARILAAEPQPGILERLRFNLSANAGLEVTVLPLAVADREGEVELVINPRDSGGTHLDAAQASAQDAERVRVPCQPLTAILHDAGIASIDALKIDIEGAEDLALAPFLRAAPTELLPRLLLIEDRPDDWTVDLYALLRQRGYALITRNRHNAVWRLP